MIPAKVARQKRGQQSARMSVRISMDSHWSERTHILIAKVNLALEAKYYYACPQRDRLVGKDHRSFPTATHKEDNQKRTSCNKFVTQLLPYVHATGLANFNTSILQIHNYPTSMTLILPPFYLKTIIKHKIDHSTQFTSYDSFYYTHLGCPSYQD